MRERRRRAAILTAAIATSVALPGLSSAQPSDAPVAPLPPALDAPWTDVAPAIDAAGARVIAAAIGAPDERLGRLAARRDSARRAGEARARASLHRWADDALASIAASPRIATSVHRAIDERAAITRVRALSDGGAVIELAVPLAALRAAAPQGGLPWAE